MLPLANRSPGLWLDDRTTPGQLSTAVGGVQSPAYWQSGAFVCTVMFVGQFCRLGGSSSVTVTLKLHVEIRLDESRAWYVTTVVPTGNDSPGEWFDVTSGFGQLSDAVGGVQETVLEQVPGSALTEMLVGQLCSTGS